MSEMASAAELLVSLARENERLKMEIERLKAELEKLQKEQ